MRDDVHGYVATFGAAPPRPLKPFSVIERTRDSEGTGRRTDTFTSSMRYALERREALRNQGRPAFVQDKDGRRVERGWT